MLRVCVIGCGPIGVDQHCRTYAKNPMVELVGVCDVIKERAEKAGTRFGVPWFLDAKDMLKQLQPDLVSVATGGVEYGSDHYEPTMQALNAGAHVLCEKPICNEIAPAREMVALADKLGLCFGVDFNHRQTPVAYAAKKWLDDGLLGDLMFFNMALWIGKFDDSTLSLNYHLKALNPHSMDMIRHYCGDAATIQMFANKAPGRVIWSTASWNMQMKNGMVGHLTSSYDIKRGHPMERCEIAGTEGRMLIEDMWRQSTLFPASTMEKRVVTNPVFDGYAGFDDTFSARINRFVDQVAAGVKPADIDGSGYDGLQAQRMIAAGILSLNEGNRPVSIDEV